MSERLDIECPICHGMRSVAKPGARQIQLGKRSAICRSCADKVRKGKRLAFEIRKCERCGKPFEATAHGRRVRCDACLRKNIPFPERDCIICGRRYRPHTIRALNGEGCSPPCRARVKLNDSYFGGRMFEADGWDGKVCQACGKHCVGSHFQIHHVYGHPNHSWLMVLCKGCHSAVSMMARAKHPLAVDSRLAELAEMQRRHGPIVEDGSPFVIKHVDNRAFRQWAKNLEKRLVADPGKVPAVVSEDLVIVRLRDARDWWGVGDSVKEQAR